MTGLHSKLSSFFNNKWFVFVGAMWMQSFAGTGYLFGSISPVIKSSLGYNQRQIATLGVAKDLGGSIGFLSGTLSEILPLWSALLVGSLQNLIGYGWIWLVITGRAVPLPLSMICILIFIGSNGETNFNTVALVSCVQNFPTSRGPVVGILKGFAGLSGAILTQIYTMIHTPDHATLVFMVAVGPTLIIIALMFIVRPIGGKKQLQSSDGPSFVFIYSVCLLLAAYLMVVTLLEDLVDLSHSATILFTLVLLLLLVLPIVIPLLLTFCTDDTSPDQESLLPVSQNEEACASEQSSDQHKVIPSEVEDEILDFSLLQTLKTADFWLLFLSLVLGSGSGLTVIDNLGQISQSLGYEETHVYVSMICIWNFLGRIGGGYISETIISEHSYPRPVALAAAQVLLAIGHLFFAMAWPGTMYIGTLLIGLGYGAHWSIVPATASDLFGLKSFGALYNVLTMASPVGSLIFSGVIVSGIYDYEAEQQHKQHNSQQSLLGRLAYGTSLGVDEASKCEGMHPYIRWEATDQPIAAQLI
ncbi:uncharacterized protein A4U43_C04F14810 [Asparagus officinalis]|uniref:Uncharacterized protein n=1 Tax=Asparagus officinalis TaxID=4686 RepID=A0A5P1F6A5_ASPOF|nr:uncharacterized protein A4U43_C04F14810 [Asparagus officinalis]